MRRLALAAVVAAAVFAHVGAFGGDFTYDDHPMVEQNMRLVLRGPSDLKPLLTSNWWGQGGEIAGERLWRPTALLSLAIDRSLLGPSPDGYRAVNVGLHVLASLLALAIFRRVTRDDGAALLGALFFAVHPV